MAKLRGTRHQQRCGTCGLPGDSFPYGYYHPPLCESCIRSSGLDAWGLSLGADSYAFFFGSCCLALRPDRSSFSQRSIEAYPCTRRIRSSRPVCLRRLKRANALPTARLGADSYAMPTLRTIAKKRSQPGLRNVKSSLLTM